MNFVIMETQASSRRRRRLSPRHSLVVSDDVILHFLLFVAGVVRAV